MNDTHAGPYVLEANSGWTHNFGVDFVVKAGEVRHGRRLAFVEYTTRHGEEPPDHTHATEDEVFYVLQGAVTFRCAGQTLDANAGSFVFLPRGIEHGYTINSTGDVRLLVVTTPAPDDSTVGWGGFIADVEQQGELLSSPSD